MAARIRWTTHVWTVAWGQVASIASGSPVSPSHPPPRALRSRAGGAPSTISTSLIPRLASLAHTWAQNLAPSLARTQIPRTCLIPSMSTPTAICAALLVT